MRGMSEESIADLARSLAEKARSASRVVARAESAVKNSALTRFAALLRERRAEVLSANASDMKEARAGGLSAALLDRLALTPERLEAAARGMEEVAALPDPVGAVDQMRGRPSGIQVGKMRAPLGVVLVIYESRPNVTADAAALAFKAGNAALLRGGGEAARSNRAIGAAFAAALREHDLPAAAAQVAPPGRDLVGALLADAVNIDLVIPRGGRGLIERVAAEARMPVLKHLDGNCHVYVDQRADLEMARRIVVNAKTRRYGVCSAMESLLVHQAAADEFLPLIARDLGAHGVELRGCERTRAVIRCAAATEEDFRAEYLAPIASVKVADSLEDAVRHINRYGSGHTDAIVTNDLSASRRFLREVDSASVMVNASTAFADGGEYGLGAEVGISTDKFHARGPVGLEGLTTQKYIVLGDGQTRA